jgi:hypothetical protein
VRLPDDEIGQHLGRLLDPFGSRPVPVHFDIGDNVGVNTKQTFNSVEMG